MYSTCIFCHRPLGSNEVVERFPVGRRLAFDPDKGRLWVVCGRCNRWNLTPLEERWEAIEDCEKRFRAANTRVSSGEIGLCRLSEGLSLIRIGRPLLPEMAAWRYGNQLVRRWKQRSAVGAVGVPISLASIVLADMLVPGSGIFAKGVSQVPAMWMMRFAFAEDPLGPWRTVVPFRLRLDHVGVPGIHRLGWNQSAIVHDRSREEPWYLLVPYWTQGEKPSKLRRLELSGTDGVALARQVLARINAAGGRNAVVERATARLEAAGSPLALYGAVAKAGGFKQRQFMRLALEMAANDDTERRAMEGELGELDDQWRAAAEIANIADNMFLPRSVEEFLRRHRVAV